MTILPMFGGCGREPAARAIEAAPPAGWRELDVTATAYNSTRGQTDGTPLTGAWGDRLGRVDSIAVSKDLVAAGLTRGAEVIIEGLDGSYVVLDRMPSKWSRKIDVFMGRDVKAAKHFGKRSVRIRWRPAPK